MNSADHAIGIMDGAYFTGRKELLVFFNELLELNLQKIEETATGAVACQVIDVMYPNTIQMKRVNWQAKNDYEYVSNYKLLQAAFDKHNIRRHIDVDKLIRGKYQDNLEFCQWLKAFFDQTISSPDSLERDYDPIYVRSKGKGGKAPSIGNNNRKQSSSSRTSSTTMPTKKLISTGARRVTNNNNSTRNPSNKSTMATFSSPQPIRTTRHDKENIQNSVVKSTVKKTRQQPSSSSMPTATPARITASNDSVVADAKLMKVNDDLTKSNSEFEILLAESEREKEFYYTKLRSIEMLMEEYENKNSASAGQDSSEENNNKNSPVVEWLLNKIKRSLYAPDEDGIPLEDEILTDVVEMDVTTDVSRPESDIIENNSTQVQQEEHQEPSLPQPSLPIIESSSNNLLLEMIGDGEEPSLMMQDSDDDSNLIDEL